MRILLAIGLCMPTSAQADVSVGASVGAGAQGSSTYSALELRLDAGWEHVRLGLGARGVWDDSELRTSEWSGPERAITIVRDLEARATWRDTTFALAGGALAPAHIGHVADGYRVALDDQWRTGVRAVVRSKTLDARVELDDVLDPALVAGSMRWLMAPPWGMHASVAIDPRAPAMRGPQTVSAIEAGVHRRYEGERALAELGVSVVAEISLGASAVAFGSGTIERGRITWTARGDVRAGTGSGGSLFGPLYRIERLAHDGDASLWDRARRGELSGASGGIALGATTQSGWLELGARARPGLGGLVVASGGAPMGRWVQAGVWLAAGGGDSAGAGELRIAWAKRLFSALQAARVYRLDAMDPIAVWSVTAWFGAASE